MPYWLSTPAMDLSIVTYIATLELRGIKCPGYVFAAKRMCILSCPLPAPRVFSQLHLLARSHDLLDRLSTACLLPKEFSGGLLTALETAWKPFRTVPFALRSEEFHAWVPVHPSSRGSIHRPHLTLPSSEEFVGARPSPRGSEEPRGDLSLRSRP